MLCCIDHLSLEVHIVLVNLNVVLPSISVCSINAFIQRNLAFQDGTEN